MCAWVEETNRLGCERRTSGASGLKELAHFEKRIKEIVTLIEDGEGSRALVARLRELEGPTEGANPRLRGALVARLRELEAEQDELTERLSAAPQPTSRTFTPTSPASTDARRSASPRRSGSPEDRDEAAEAIRGLIERIVLTPAARNGARWTPRCTATSARSSNGPPPGPDGARPALPLRECRSRLLRGQDSNLRPSGDEPESLPPVLTAAPAPARRCRAGSRASRPGW